MNRLQKIIIFLSLFAMVFLGCLTMLDLDLVMVNDTEFYYRPVIHDYNQLILYLVIVGVIGKILISAVATKPSKT